MSVAESALLNWPSPEQEQLLRMLVAVPPTPAVLCDWLDRTALPVDADTSKLLPAIHLALARAGADRPLLKAHYRQTWVKNQRTVQGGIEAASLLRAASIPAALIKGVPLCLFYHEDIGARPMADADLVVQKDDLLRADAVLRSGGWSRQERPRASLLPYLTYFNYRHRLHTSVDLQRYPFRPTSPPAAVRRFWAHCVERTVHGMTVLVPDATYQLLLTCLHGRKPERSLARWPFDAHAILRRAADEIDWDELVSVASEAMILPPVRDALRYLARLGLPVPAEVSRILGAVSETPAERRHYRLLTRGPDRWRLIDVLSERWEEFSAVVRREDSLRRALTFPLYSVSASAYYNRRSVTLREVATRLAREWRHRAAR